MTPDPSEWDKRAVVAWLEAERQRPPLVAWRDPYEVERRPLGPCTFHRCYSVRRSHLGPPFCKRHGG